MGTLATYKPLYVWCSPASIPQIVAHIQDYLVKNPIVSTETVAEIVVQSLQEHPELINGDVIPITEDSAQTIKEYIDALPSLDGYTKAETDALLLLKQNLLTWDQTPTVGSSNPVTSEGIKAAISASAAALADLISTKADIASVYTKATTDALLLQKADAATTYSKNAVDALLDTKVDINDTYTKADIDLMKQVDKANTAIVSATDGTAPLNIAAGQYVYLGDILYMATEPIPEGDPLVPGTNIALNPKGVTNVIGDGLQNLARTVGEQSDQIVYLNGKVMQANENISDCNNAVNGRAYNFIDTTLHRPNFNFGTLFQIGTAPDNNGYKTQIACDIIGNKFAFRRTANNSWSNESWNELTLAAQTEELETKVGRLGKTGTLTEHWTWGAMVQGQGFIVPLVNCNNITVSAVKVFVNGAWNNLVVYAQPDPNYLLFNKIVCTVPNGVVLEDGKIYLTGVSGTIS